MACQPDGYTGRRLAFGRIKNMNQEENNLLVSVKEIKKIDKTTAKVEIINSIKDTHKALRQKSKGP